MKIWNEIWDYVKMIIIVVVVVLFVNNFILINAKIPSESMENTIMTGDRVFGFRLAYGLNVDLFGNHISKKVKDPERFDIIIFKYPDDESQLFIKRLIGLPGETVEIRDGKVYIDGAWSRWMTALFLRCLPETTDHIRFLRILTLCLETTGKIQGIPDSGTTPLSPLIRSWEKQCSVISHPLKS